MHDILDAVRQFDALYDGAIFMSDTRSSCSRAGFSARAHAMASTLQSMPDRIGLLAENGVDWAVAQVGAWIAGKVVVPLPLFFSTQQLGHIIRDAALTHAIITTSTAKLAADLGLNGISIERGARKAAFDVIPGGGQIIYTSGSTGQPKGVRLALAQINASAQMLLLATSATKSDNYLSILPLPLLLETIGAICVPLLAGAHVQFDAPLTATALKGHVAGLNSAITAHNPTSTILVPELLTAWVAELESTGSTAPASLRFVAVGGAPVSEVISQKAWSLGIPVYEGYGLSECCSVVALNTPKERKPGTVGRPLSALNVSIENGEIVVGGATVMQGYLHGNSVSGPYRTGDLGEIDEQGYLKVHGRIDNQIVTSLGRNISPEWIETMLIADPRLAAVAVTVNAASHPMAVLVPTLAGESWLMNSSQDEVLNLMAERCRQAPQYAVPKSFKAVTRKSAAACGLMTANGRFNRKAIADFAATA